MSELPGSQGKKGIDSFTDTLFLRRDRVYLHTILKPVYYKGPPKGGLKSHLKLKLKQLQKIFLYDFSYMYPQ